MTENIKIYYFYHSLLLNFSFLWSDDDILELKLEILKRYTRDIAKINSISIRTIMMNLKCKVQQQALILKC
jgi:hypothetical protein